MNILICTQVVDKNHPVLGFFHRWVEEFAVHATEVHVLCLFEGEHDLPKNVHVYSLGKNEGKGRFAYLYRFYTYSWQLRKKYDAVFVHMNQIYVLLGWPLWALLGKRIGLWYMHRSVDWTLRVAEKLVDEIFTASPESFRLPSKKLYVTGHGIDTERFAFRECEKTIDLLTIGRITRSKNLLFLVDVLKMLRERGHDVTLTIIGKATTPEEQEYEAELKTYIATHVLSESVILRGAVPNSELPEYIAKAKVFVHAATNGSLDKALLEPLAMGVPVVTSAEGASSLPLGEWQVVAETGSFVSVIHQILQQDTLLQSSALQEYVHEHHSLQMLIPKILGTIAGGKRV